jgi:hypothetical protein
MKTALWPLWHAQIAMARAATEFGQPLILCRHSILLTKSRFVANVTPTVTERIWPASMAADCLNQGWL